MTHGTEHNEYNIDISDLTESFVQNLIQDKDDILQCCNNHDTECLSRVAHKISGAAQMFGFVELSQSAAELERAIKKQHVNIVNDLTDCLLDEINAILHQNKKNN
ncbi:Hpt domain-containing protein [Colwellia sp. MSW7]|uniref:Hpt domain-containing protein n=1 Tax=Colwellia maritima TaxID=2912588 RepID=A0ABS9X7B7_9GAMM|nr:Hpt domain-containing protein [Colwellia maritima]MCI2285672.1 Hpt domain-containing protein [Colwellia maritima]